MNETTLRRTNRLAVVLTVLSALAIGFLSFMVVKPNRVAQGEAKSILQLLDLPAVWLLLAVWLVWAMVGLMVDKRRVRLTVAIVACLALLLCLGWSASSLAAGKAAARITPAGAFWALFGVFALSLTDALLRFTLKPYQKLLFLAVFVLCVLGLIMSGMLDSLAIMREYTQRKAQFWDEGVRHLNLTFGSLGIALLLGLPLGVLCFMWPKIRGAVLQTLSLLQTVPSLALFGLLMVPLGYLAAHSPLAASLGIRGIGVAPALIAMVIYSLLPVVANTVVGLNSVSESVRDAGRGMGLTRAQMLWQIELPLAFPVILTGIRIVLVQAIGLVTVAALVGGGGFGTFVFQGVGQTATDLVLLGALPTVFLAFSAAVILDALVDSIKKGDKQ
ncbi:MAG: ABC transporter permease [Formosimonas sp.]